MDVTLTYYEQQHQQLESTLRSLQDQVTAIKVMKADSWRLAACFFVFLMQVGCPTSNWYRYAQLLKKPLTQGSVSLHWTVSAQNLSSTRERKFQVPSPTQQKKMDLLGTVGRPVRRKSEWLLGN